MGLTESELEVETINKGLVAPQLDLRMHVLTVS